MRKSIKNGLSALGLLEPLKAVRRSVNFKQRLRVGKSVFRTISIYGSKATVSEQWMLDILKIVLPSRPGVFLDVGANNGSTLLSLKAIDPSRLYIGFEPNPVCCMMLLELIRLNAWTDARCIPVGLFESDSILKLDLYDDNLTGSGGSVVKDYWKWSERVPARSMFVPLMRFLTVERSLEISQIGIIKIDVEGAEAEVLHTLSERIETDRPVILFEVLSAYSKENELRISRQEMVLATLRRLEYSVFRIIESPRPQSKLLRVEEIDCFDPYYDKNMCNYLSIPKEETLEIKRLIEANVPITLL